MLLQILGEEEEEEHEEEEHHHEEGEEHEHDHEEGGGAMGNKLANHLKDADFFEVVCVPNIYNDIY